MYLLLCSECKKPSLVVVIGGAALGEEKCVAGIIR